MTTHPNHTVNPVVGCSHCSPGCEHCYAEKFAARLAKNPSTCAKYDGIVTVDGRWTGNTSKPDLSVFDKLPKSSRKVFVGSMTDIFHENTPYNRIDDLFIKIAQFPQHTFLFLTKRPHIMASYFSSDDSEYWLTWGKTVEEQQHLAWPQKNVWLGVTVCNQEEANEKLPILMKIPAAMRFVSVEPMLEAIDLSDFLAGHCDCDACVHGYGHSPFLDWVICGAETGPSARPIDLQWARDLRDQCQRANTPFFFKKAGDRKPIPQDLLVRQFPESV